ncbi:MAG: flagellar basal body-associated FliL family protein [Deltaproteobacteria bacterium]|nr:flagellar basal body-associated FliL family protein [Deltaproteobacteria bacterium]
MAKKATLDVLDIQVDEIAAEKQQEDTLALDKEAEAPAGQQAPRRLFVLLKRLLFRPMVWMPLLGLLVLVPLVIMVVSFHDGSEKSREVSKAPSPKVQAPTPGEFVVLAGFVIDLKDDRGAAKVVFCDAVLNLEKSEKTVADRNWADGRNLIYMKLKKKKPHELLSPEDRNRLKIELRDDLNGLLGANLIKSVYFTRFEIF